MPRWQLPLGELEETARTPSYYVEDYPAGPEIQQSFPEWSNWRGPESSTLETDVYIWHYALLAVHARKAEDISGNQWLFNPCVRQNCCTQHWHWTLNCWYINESFNVAWIAKLMLGPQQNISLECHIIQSGKERQKRSLKTLPENRLLNPTHATSH